MARVASCVMVLSDTSVVPAWSQRVVDQHHTHVSIHCKACRCLVVLAGDKVEVGGLGPLGVGPVVDGGVADLT